MFGRNKEIAYAGLVERIGVVPMGEAGCQYVLMLQGNPATIVIQGGWLIGEFERMRNTLALTMTGDELVFTLKDEKLSSFANNTLAGRAAALSRTSMTPR